MTSFGGFGSTAPSFGSTANTQTSAGTLFGGSATNTSAAPSNTMFGASSSTNAAGTLFGANTNNSTAGTLFGGSATPASTGFGGFGSTPATSTPAAGGFGSGFGATSSAPAATGSFGTTQPTTGFGGFGATPATSTASTGFGGFGAAPATSTASTGFGGFGATPATSTASTGFGGFGTTPATSTASTGFGGFGNTATSTPATSTASTGFGGFGATPATSTASTGFGGFGATPATSTASTGFGGFGNTAAKPAFGGFGTTNTTGNGLFGAPNTNPGLNGQTSTGFGLPQQQQQQPVQEKVWEELALIRARFDPTSANCYFRHYFYNMVPENEVHLYRRPENQTEQAWNEAMRKNPDPKRYVPVLAVGFDDILKRMEVQSKQVELHQDKLKETSERLQSVQRQYVLGTLVKIEEHKRRHTDLTQRLLRLLRYSSVLRYKGFPLNGEETVCAQQLAQLAESSESPEQLNAKMNVLWNRLQNLKAQLSQGGDNRYEVWRTVSEEDTNAIAKILSDEQRGIKHMTSILKSDEKELETIEAGLKERLRSDMST